MLFITDFTLSFIITFLFCTKLMKLIIDTYKFSDDDDSITIEISYKKDVKLKPNQKKGPKRAKTALKGPNITNM